MTTSNISIKVEFLAGTSITQCLDEAKEKAILWDVAYVKFDFNGVKVSCQQAFTTKYWADKVMLALGEEFKYVVCSLRGEE